MEREVPGQVRGGYSSDEASAAVAAESGEIGDPARYLAVTGTACQQLRLRNVESAGRASK